MERGNRQGSLLVNHPRRRQKRENRMIFPTFASAFKSGRHEPDCFDKLCGPPALPFLFLVTVELIQVSIFSDNHQNIPVMDKVVPLRRHLNALARANCHHIDAIA